MKNLFRVLIVDDDQDEILLFKDSLQDLYPSVEVIYENDGHRILPLLEASSQHKLPDLILLDLNMPRIHGFEVLSWIKSQKEYQRIPTVIFSSSSSREDQKKSRQLGADDFMSKPNSVTGYNECIEALHSKWLS